MKVCILAAGLGTRLGPVSDFLHKALLPLGNQAVLSRIISYFPSQTEFVIALGNKADQIRSFIKLVHPELQVTFVDVDPYRGPGSGPGYSLLSCGEHLREPFVFTACDTLNMNALPALDSNWIGVAEVSDPHNWCAVVTDEKGKVTGLEYKLKTSKAKFAFTGVAFVKDHQTFWDALEDSSKKADREVQVDAGILALLSKGLKIHDLDWRDTGNLENYQNLLKSFGKNFTFTGKTTEITYLYSDRVVKLYPSEEKAKTCFHQATRMGNSIAEILGRQGSILAYRFVQGDLLSKHLNGVETENFLNWLQKDFWKDEKIDPAKFKKALTEFYIDKTLGRLKALEEKNPDLASQFNQALEINGLQCESATAMVRKLSEAVLQDAYPSLMHGDLHADNVIKTDQGYKLIDWRDSFAGLDVGDRYYDLAKFLHTFDLSVETMDAGTFRYSTQGQKVSIDHPCNYHELDGRDAFWEFIEKNGYSRQRVELINALIFLNMSPLYDRDLGLYLYYLGRYLLQKTLTRITSKYS